MITNKRMLRTLVCLAVVLLLLTSSAGCGKKGDPRPSGGAMMELTEDTLAQSFRSIHIDGSAKRLSWRVAIEDKGDREPRTVYLVQEIVAKEGI